MSCVRMRANYFVMVFLPSRVAGPPACNYIMSAVYLGRYFSDEKYGSKDHKFYHLTNALKKNG